MSSFKMHSNPSGHRHDEHVELPELSEDREVTSSDINLSMGPTSMPRASKSFKVKRMAVKGHRSGRSCTITLDAHAHPEEVDLERIKQLIGAFRSWRRESLLVFVLHV